MNASAEQRQQKAALPSETAKLIHTHPDRSTRALKGGLDATAFEERHLDPTVVTKF